MKNSRYPEKYDKETPSLPRSLEKMLLEASIRKEKFLVTSINVRHTQADDILILTKTRTEIKTTVQKLE